jgi:3-hydroxyacyl-CoA dehydrogenase
MTDTALDNVRWIADWGRQNQGFALGSSAPRRRIGSVGVVGAGIMGTSIAAAHVQYRLPVTIHDVNAEALDRAPAAVAAALEQADSHCTPSLLRRLLRPTADLAEIARCDLVLEAIAETAAAKWQLYAKLQGHLGKRTIVASNTSTIPLQRLARGFVDASRFCGLHFCHPVHKRPLVEVVRGPATSEATISAAVAHARRIDRMPMVVQDGPGFVVNRLLFPYLGSALELLSEDVPADAIERAALEFGMAMGPLGLMDEIGLDTTLQAAWVLAAAFPERVVSSPLLVSLIKAGRRGRKTGAGFFSYHNSAVAEDGPSSGAVREVRGAIGSRKNYSAMLSHRLVLPMLLEATRILEEGKVRDVRDIDLAVLFGLGFPAAKGGLLWWADTLGAEQIMGLLQSIPATSPQTEPTPMLTRMAKTGTTFYLPSVPIRSTGRQAFRPALEMSHADPIG